MSVFLAAKRGVDQMTRGAHLYLTLERRKHSGVAPFTHVHVQVIWSPGLGTEAQVQTLHPTAGSVPGSWVALASCPPTLHFLLHRRKRIIPAPAPF